MNAWYDVCGCPVESCVCVSGPDLEELGRMPQERYDADRMTSWMGTSGDWSYDQADIYSAAPQPELDEINWTHEEWQAEAGLGNLMEAGNVDYGNEDTASMLELMALAEQEAAAEAYDPSQWQQRY